MVKDAVNKGFNRYFTFPRNSFLGCFENGKTVFGNFFTFWECFWETGFITVFKKRGALCERKVIRADVKKEYWRNVRRCAGHMM